MAAVIKIPTENIANRTLRSPPAVFALIRPPASWCDPDRHLRASAPHAFAGGFDRNLAARQGKD